MVTGVEGIEVEVANARQKDEICQCSLIPKGFHISKYRSKAEQCPIQMIDRADL